MTVLTSYTVQKNVRHKKKLQSVKTLASQNPETHKNHLKVDLYFRHNITINMNVIYKNYVFRNQSILSLDDPGRDSAVAMQHSKKLKDKKQCYAEIFKLQKLL